MSEDGSVSIEAVEVVSPPKANSVEVFASELQQRGFLDGVELFGEDFGSRAVTLNPLDIIEKTDIKNVTKIIPLEEIEDELKPKEKEVASLLATLGYVDVVDGIDQRGKPKRLLHTSRPIENLQGGTAFRWNEVIDPNAETTVIEKDEASGKSIFGYEAERVFTAGNTTMSANNGPESTYIDLQELKKGKEQTPAIPLFVGMVKDGKIVKSRGLEYVASRENDFLGMQVVTDLDGVASYGHESGHRAYSQAIDDWDANMKVARRIFNGQSSEISMTPETARKLISFNERAAWDAERQMLGFAQQQPGYKIELLDIVITNAQQEERSLLSYDMASHTGSDPNPEAFSRFMRNLRDVAREKGVTTRFNEQTGEKISHCPILQLAQEGVDIKTILEESSTMSEAQLKNVEQV